MALKHRVKVLVSFEVVTELGALMVGDKEVAPARVLTTKYTDGSKLIFDTKAHALAFAKFHGNKVEYIGKEQG